MAAIPYNKRVNKRGYLMFDDDMLNKALIEISKDSDAIATLQSYYDAYTEECEELRKTEGNADNVSDEWTEKSHHYLIDWMIYKASDELSDYYCDEEYTDEFITELDREIISKILT